jgi:putative PIN family toxin of toxin-antitoxin system
VSALINQSYPHLVVYYVSKQKNVQWCISDIVQAEYTDVLKRTKFSKFNKFSDNADSLLEDIEEFTTKYYPEIHLDIIKDISDNKFLELAVTCDANFLITGNTRDFIFNSYENTKIVTPKEYWEKYRP